MYELGKCVITTHANSTRPAFFADQRHTLGVRFDAVYISAKYVRPPTNHKYAPHLPKLGRRDYEAVNQIFLRLPSGNDKPKPQEWPRGGTSKAGTNLHAPPYST